MEYEKGDILKLNKLGVQRLGGRNSKTKAELVQRRWKFIKISNDLDFWEENCLYAQRIDEGLKQKQHLTSRYLEKA